MILPVGLVVLAEYMSPYLHRVTRDTPLANENVAVDPEQQAWKMELMNKRTLKLHQDVQQLYGHMDVPLPPALSRGDVGSPETPVVPELRAKLQELAEALAAATQQLAALEASGEGTAASEGTVASAEEGR